MSQRDQRDFGGEFVIALVALAVLVFAAVFGILLTLWSRGDANDAAASPTTAIAGLYETISVTQPTTQASTATSSTVPLLTGTLAVEGRTLPGTAAWTASPTMTPTFTATPSATPSATPTASPSVTPTPTPTPTLTFTPTSTSTITPSLTMTPTVTNSVTSRPRVLPPAVFTAARRATVTPSSTSTSTPSATVTITSTWTATATPTPTNTNTLTASPSMTPLPTATDTATLTNTVTMTATALATHTLIPTRSSPTITPLSNPTATATTPPLPQIETMQPCVPPADWILYTARFGETLELLSAAVDEPVNSLLSANCRADEEDTHLLAGNTVYLPTMPRSARPPERETLIGCVDEESAFFDNIEPGAMLENEVTLTGSANAVNFWYAKIELRSVESNAYQFVTRVRRSVVSNVLSVLDTTQYESGDYWLRLVVYNLRSQIPLTGVCVVPITIRPAVTESP